MNKEQSGCTARRRRLNELLRVIGIECQETVELSGISDRAQEIGENGLFVALQGTRTDGRQWAELVRQRGGYVLSDQPGERTFVHPDPRSVYPLLLQAYYDYPALKLTMIGVTGTNGKSTVTQLLYDLFCENGRRCCLIGTGRILIEGENRASPNTTPDPLTLVRLLDEACQRGVEVVIMEVSSQALAMHRVEGLFFDLAVLTNLKQDHLDYHKTLKAYQQAKFLLFEKLKEKGTAILNQDDPITRRWLAKIGRPVFTYGEESVNFRIKPIAETWNSLTFELNDHRIETPLAGAFNRYNLTAALACGFALDLAWEKMLDFARHARLPAGRMEIVTEHPVLAVVDYAHTASAMEAMLKHWRTMADQRGRQLWVVFGCGGDREADKRPQMGRLACTYCDHVVLCDDNPRSEDPNRILAQIAEGCDGRQKIIRERGEAIKFVLDGAQTDDIIIVAGKGGETSLIQDTTMTCLSDREWIERWLGQAGRKETCF